LRAVALQAPGTDPCVASHSQTQLPGSAALFAEDGTGGRGVDVRAAPWRAPSKKEVVRHRTPGRRHVPTLRRGPAAARHGGFWLLGPPPWPGTPRLSQPARVGTPPTRAC